MKAIVYEKYGPPDVLQLREIEKPVPGDDEVLVKVHAASVNAFDWRLLRADPFLVRLTDGFFRPRNRIPGVDISGEVVEIGRGVRGFQPGDQVFGDLSGWGSGGFAEYVCAGEKVLQEKSPGMTFEEAAAFPMAAVTALRGLRDRGKIREGQEVLINGASGGVGTFAVQIAKAFDTTVTAVCSTGKMELVKSLGADNVIDYTREDFARGQKKYDLILAANGNRSIWDYKRALKPGGIYVMSGGSMTQMSQAVFLGPLISLFAKQRMGTFVSTPSREDLMFLRELFEAGKVRPVIDKAFPLSRVPDAIRYIEEGHAAGKVVINLAGDQIPPEANL